MVNLALYPSEGNPRSEHWQGLLEPAVSSISGQWVEGGWGGSESPA